jgi:hypothetical protein
VKLRKDKPILENATGEFQQHVAVGLIGENLSKKEKITHKQNKSILS